MTRAGSRGIWLRASIEDFHGIVSFLGPTMGDVPKSTTSDQTDHPRGSNRRSWVKAGFF